MRATRTLRTAAILFAQILSVPPLAAQTVNNGAPSSLPPGTAPGDIGTVPGGRTGSSSAAGTFLSGRVATDDGTSLPIGVAIQKLCSTVTQTVAWTDAQGNFSFQWGNTGAVALDASQSGSRTSSGVLGTLQGIIGPTSNISSAGASAGMNSGPMGAVLNCELRASLPGYRSDSINMTGRRPNDNPDLGLIVLHHAGGRENPVVTAATLRIPKPAADAYRKALKSRGAGDNVGAEKALELAVKLYPPFPEAWLELGLLKGREKQWTESAHCLDQGLKLNPEAQPQAWYADAMAHYYLAEYDDAERSARQTIRLDTEQRTPRAGYVLGMILAQKHDYADAAAALRAYLEKAPNAPDIEQIRAQLAEIESLR